MTVSIVIPLFNRWDMTAKCLVALGGIDAEVILVDNGSTDETAEHDVTIRNPRNRGFAIACNQGARASTGDVIIFLNNDTEPRPGWLEPLVAAVGNGIAGPKLVYPDGSIQSAGILVDFSQPPGHEAVNLQTETKGGDIWAVSGACLAISRDAWDEALGFDTGFYNGYEDVDLCLTVRSSFRPVTYVPESVVVHHESQSDRRERFRDVGQNVARLRAKWGDAQCGF